MILSRDIDDIIINNHHSIFMMASLTEEPGTGQGNPRTIALRQYSKSSTNISLR